MFRTSDIVLIAVMVSAAAFTYKTKHEAENWQAEVRRLQQQIRFEEDTTDLLRADWSLLTQPSRLQRLTGVPAPRVKLPGQVNVLGAYALERFNKWRGAEMRLDPQEVEIGEHWFWLDATKSKEELGYEARDTWPEGV